MTRKIAVIVPVHRNAATLGELVDRIDCALVGWEWRLRLVIDASPDDSAAVACEIAAKDARVAVTELYENVGQHAALTLGLAEENDAWAWVCLDADLQDPPEAVPLLLSRLAGAEVGAVFAGRRGAYEDRLRRMTGSVHRQLLHRLTGLPPDAGAFVAMGAEARAAVVALGGPSIVASIGTSGVATTSLPVTRASRPTGTSSWTGRARMRQSLRTLSWAISRRP